MALEGLVVRLLVVLVVMVVLVVSVVLVVPVVLTILPLEALVVLVFLIPEINPLQAHLSVVFRHNNLFISLLMALLVITCNVNIISMWSSIVSYLS